MRLFTLSIFILLTSSSFAQKVTDNSDTFITITKGKFSFDYPMTWTVDTSNLFGAAVFVISPLTDSLDTFRENMNFFIQDLTGKNYTLSKMGQESEVQIKNLATDVQIIESRLDSSALPIHYLLKYTSRQGKFSLTTIQRYYLKDEVGYAVTMTIQQGKEQDFSSAADKIFNSFRFQK